MILNVKNFDPFHTTPIVHLLLAHHLNDNLSMTRCLALFLFISSLLAPVPVQGAEFVPAYLPTRERPNLEVNRDASVKYRIHKCEKEGVRDMRKLATPFEEFWVFVPGRCTWIELGILQQIRGTIRRDGQGRCRPPSPIAGVRKNDVSELLRETNALVMYHPHPANSLLVDYALKQPGGGAAFSEDCLRQARLETLEAALPGLPDLNSLFTFAGLFYQKHPGGEFSEKIVSVYGVTEYRLSAEGRRALDSPQYTQVVRQAMRRYFVRRNQVSATAYRASSSTDENRHKIQKLIADLVPAGGLFSMTFRPFE